MLMTAFDPKRTLASDSDDRIFRADPSRQYVGCRLFRFLKAGDDVTELGDWGNPDLKGAGREEAVTS